LCSLSEDVDSVADESFDEGAGPPLAAILTAFKNDLNVQFELTRFDRFENICPAKNHSF
jgi:hypothetical protein